MRRQSATLVPGAPLPAQVSLLRDNPALKALASHMQQSPRDHFPGFSMRLAVLSNVHANVEALRAVLRVVRRDGIRKIICLGDLVGHHAFPVETLALIRAGGTACIAGNHDLMTIGRITGDGWTPRSRRAIGWTRRTMTGEDYEYLANLPGELHSGDDLLFVHAALGDPARELRTAAQLLEEYRSIKERYPAVRICFTGHSSEPRLIEITPEG